MLIFNLILTIDLLKNIHLYQHQGHLTSNDKWIEINLYYFCHFQYNVPLIVWHYIIFFYALCTLVLNIFPFSGSHFNPATLTLALVVCWIFLFYTMQRFLFLSILSSTAHTLGIEAPFS